MPNKKDTYYFDTINAVRIYDNYIDSIVLFAVGGSTIPERSHPILNNIE